MAYTHIYILFRHSNRNNVPFSREAQAFLTDLLNADNLERNTADFDKAMEQYLPPDSGPLGEVPTINEYLRPHFRSRICMSPALQLYSGGFIPVF